MSVLYSSAIRTDLFHSSKSADSLLVHSDFCNLRWEYVDVIDRINSRRSVFSVMCELSFNCFFKLTFYVFLSWLRRLDAGLSPRRSGFDSVSVRASMWCTEWRWDWFFSEYFRLSLSLSLPQCSILI